MQSTCTTCQRSIPRGGFPRVCRFHFISWVRGIANEREWRAFVSLLKTRSLLLTDDHSQYIGILEGLPDEELDEHLLSIRGSNRIGVARYA